MEQQKPGLVPGFAFCGMVYGMPQLLPATFARNMWSRYLNANNPNPPIRMVAVDMDGTLLNEEGRISPRNLAAVRAAEAAGVEIVVATGRRHSYAMHILRPLGLHHASPLVSSNGAVTRTLGSPDVPSELVARAHLSHATSLWLLRHLAEFRNALVITFDRVGPDGEQLVRGALVVEHLEDLHLSIGRWMAANAPYIAHINPIENALSPDDPAIQMMLCGSVARMAHAESLLVQAIESSSPRPEVTLQRTSYPDRNLCILDILPSGCSKGAAILSLAASRSIEPSEILAIGDNWNDVSMLEAAGRAVLMDNAPDDLKALARTRGWHIGPANHADGVAEAIESALTVGEMIG